MESPSERKYIQEPDSSEGRIDLSDEAVGHLLSSVNTPTLKPLTHLDTDVVDLLSNNNDILQVGGSGPDSTGQSQNSCLC